LPEIAPFPGIRYRVPEEDLARVLSPPYDVIGPAYRDELYARDPRNVVRLVLNRTVGDDGYAEAGDTFRRWLAEGVLAADPEPALYLLEQGFHHGDRTLRRYGLLARFRAEDPGGTILPHEQTRPGPREDRYRVLKATRANFSPIFLMFPDAGAFAAEVARVVESPPAANCKDDAGVRHRLWTVTDPERVKAFRDALAAVKAYIADGHHRYATALRYRDEVGPDGAWTFGYFTPLDAPGLVVLPYHRVLGEGPTRDEARSLLEKTFLVSDVKDAATAAQGAAESTMPYAFGFAWPESGGLVAEALPEAEDLLGAEAPPSLRALDTYFLQRALLGRLLGVPDGAVDYVHSFPEAEATVREGRCRLAVLLRATPVRQIVAVAEARESMPAKSTFFHPKLPSGLVIHPLVGEGRG
jgi:uncharacterized protein (DUF1015 family)